ncbi:MAG TPA: cytochrome c3 family protein [Allosphingosinicella sp.]|nr:cytochrome c3 family protein [Allosphingosinicella sp.]
MAFVIRQVSRSAAGREIVRTTRIEGDRLSIGRDPSNQVHIADLAVALHHAVVERTSPGRLEVTAQTGLTIEVNGWADDKGRIELGSGGDIRIATHILRFMPTAAESDEIRVVLERVTDGDAAVDRDDERMFSLGAVMPSKRAAAWLGVLAVLGLFLVWPVSSYYQRQQGGAEQFQPEAMWSSGKLSAAHSRLESNCRACHIKPFEAVRDQSCKACHSNVHEHADPFRLARAQPDLNRWGRIRLAFQETFDIPPGRCVECHTEHEGPQAMPATAQRFCSDCHARLTGKLHDTKLADAGDFGRTHPQFQPAIMTAWDGDRPLLRRVPIDGRPREISNLKFPHAVHLSKTNGVAQMARRLAGDHGFGDALACKDCHDPTPDGVRFQPVGMEEDCGMCHSLAFDWQGGTLRTLRHGEPAQVVADLRDFYRARPPNPPATLGGMARRRPGDVPAAGARVRFAIGSGNPARAERAIRAIFSPGGACFDCHQVQAPPRGSLAYRIMPVAFPVRYMHKGWFDHGPHQTETCSTCHSAERSQTSSDLLLPGIGTCRSCHGGEDAAKQVPSACAMCHDYHRDAGAPSQLIRQRVRGKRKVGSAALDAAQP